MIKTITGCQIIQKYLSLHHQFKHKISNNMNVSIYLLKKTYKISKIYNKIHENIQITYEIFEKFTYIQPNYDNTYTSSNKIEYHTDTMFTFWNK